MRLARIADRELVFVFLAVLTFLVSGIVTASPNPRKQQGHLVPQPESYVYPIGFKVLSPTEGIDFMPYLSTLPNSLAASFHAKIPKSAVVGEKGVVVVRVRIQKDGSLSDNSVTVASSSGKDEVDVAALSVIRTAAPFQRLPEAFSGNYIDLQIRFYYGNQPQEPEEKPEIVPIHPAVSPTA
jgi:TonB family protein